MNSVKNFFNHLKVYFINFFFYKIRPSLKKIKKKQFINKYKISFSESKFVLPQDIKPLQPDYLDLNNLVNQILKLKPQCVLELGTGYSTYAIIFALNKLKEDIGHKFKFYAIDQNEEYFRISIMKYNDRCNKFNIVNESENVFKTSFILNTAFPAPPLFEVHIFIILIIK